MKRNLIILLLSLFALSAAAQEETKAATGFWRPKYRNLSYNIEKMTFKHELYDGLAFDSKFGVSFTRGRTYFLHKTPILRMIRIGIDATWCDLTYTNYQPKWSDYFGESGYEDEDDDKLTIHKAEVGMHVGPSVTVNPISKLNVHGYFRFAPTFAMMYDDDAFRGNYASMFVTGASLSYGIIGVGIEKRWGTCKYKGLFGSGDDEEDDDYYVSDDLYKIKTSGLRVYLTFRFGR